jgi:hypothetical protein
MLWCMIYGRIYSCMMRDGSFNKKVKSISFPNKHGGFFHGPSQAWRVI